MDFASLMKSQISSVPTTDSSNKKYLKRSEVEAQRETVYQREQEQLELRRLERLEKKRRRDEDEAEREGAREKKKKRLAEESKKRAEEESHRAENVRRKRIGLPELEWKGDEIEGAGLKVGEEDLADDELRQKLHDMEEPRILFGETHILRLRRYRKLVADALAPTMSEGPIPTIIQLVEEKDMKVPSTVPQDDEGKSLLHRQIASYFTMVLSEWSLALSRRPASVRESFSGRQAYTSYTQARDNLTPLFRQLEPPTPTIAPVLLTAITEIVNLMQLKRYVHANDAYLRLSIGKAAWPIGVTMVGIHERSARERLHEKADDKAHILTDERTRKMLQGIKRCLSYAQIRWPPEDLGQLMG
ncbi:hypothetical protein LTR62_008052 [Meristemomyces frigidus]|uniref:Pre-mRNA-splicing factor 18 n=1 Tax=Meristemomyces frigidus TaxID=1508187 RepID=A0AAN7YMD4_9PEZI|nr:hypothetical protein LTR62_008052 [Meristemomyces frigidus]